MTKLGLRPYAAGDGPVPGSVPVSVVVLTRDEEPNIGRCLTSLAWADQVLVVDSGSADRTVPIARSRGAEVVEQPWLGYSGQREFALRMPQLRHDWVYFVDADEWVSPQLAEEIGAALRAPSCAAFRAPPSARLPGHLDPPLRLVQRLVGRSAGGPAVHQVRRNLWWRVHTWMDPPAVCATTLSMKTLRELLPGCTNTCAMRSWKLQRRGRACSVVKPAPRTAASR